MKKNVQEVHHDIRAGLISAVREMAAIGERRSGSRLDGLKEPIRFPDGSVFDPSHAILIDVSEPSGHTVEHLYLTREGGFVRMVTKGTLDGELLHDTYLENTHPHLMKITEKAARERRRRLGVRALAFHLPFDDATEWAVLVFIQPPLCEAVLKPMGRNPKTLEDLDPAPAEKGAS